MFYININRNGIEEKLECVTTLRVAMNIQTKLKKPYMKVLQNIEELDLQNQIQVLYTGIELGANKEQISYSEFLNYILDGGMGLDEIGSYIEQLCNGLQYPGLSEDEIEKKLKEKIEKQKRIQENG